MLVCEESSNYTAQNQIKDEWKQTGIWDISYSEPQLDTTT